MIMSGGRRGGGGNFTVQRISVDETVKEIKTFVKLYAIAAIVQIAIVVSVAIVLGDMCGPVFVALSIALNFSPRALVDVRPFRIGLYIESTWHNRKKPGYVLLTQLILAAFGIGAIILLIVGYFPNVWAWRFDFSWSLASRLPWANEWHAVSDIEMVVRGLLLFGIPFVGWPSMLIMKWSSRMEATRPTAREAQHERLDPSTIEGPLGEEYRRASSGDDDEGDGAVILPPEY